MFKGMFLMKTTFSNQSSVGPMSLILENNAFLDQNSNLYLQFCVLAYLYHPNESQGLVRTSLLFDFLR